MLALVFTTEFSRFIISIPQLLLILHEFKDVISRNNAVGEKAGHCVCLLLIVLQNSVEFYISDMSIGLAGAEKHQLAAQVVEARRAEGECGESACIDAGNFLEVQYDFVADVYANIEPGRLRVALERAEVGQF
jgi:hypothetical protein